MEWVMIYYIALKGNMIGTGSAYFRTQEACEKAGINMILKSKMVATVYWCNPTG